MNREEAFQAIGGIDDRFIAEAIRYTPEDATAAPERIVPMKKKRIITLALAAALLLSLGIVAYAAWSIHAARQKEIKTDLRIEENHAGSYLEYPVPTQDAAGLVLLSTVNDGEVQHVYVNISPVTDAEIAAFPESTRFVWTIEGTEVGGFAGPQLPVELNLSGQEAIRKAVREYAYDADTQTLTLQCYVDTAMARKAAEQLGSENLPLLVSVLSGEEQRHTFGPCPLTITREQRRFFDFGGKVYHDEKLDRDIELVGLELTPFSAVWKVRYEDAAAVHQPGADAEKSAPWSELEDRVCIDGRIGFADGSDFSTGGAMTCPYRDGVVELHCAWGAAIDLDAVQRITLGELTLWENN